MTPRATLADLMGGELPSGLGALDDADLAALVDALEAAKSRQAEALERAVDDGLAIVPRILRGTLRKALFG